MIASMAAKFNESFRELTIMDKLETLEHDIKQLSQYVMQEDEISKQFKEKHWLDIVARIEEREKKLVKQQQKHQDAIPKIQVGVAGENVEREFETSYKEVKCSFHSVSSRSDYEEGAASSIKPTARRFKLSSTNLPAFKMYENL